MTQTWPKRRNNGIRQYLQGPEETTIYLREYSSDFGVEYSTDNNTWLSITGWPVYIQNMSVNPSSALIIKLVTNISLDTIIPTNENGTLNGYNPNLNASSGYFVFTSDYITIDGDFYYFNISGLTNYVGLFNNGTGTNAYKNITIRNLGVISSNSSTLLSDSNNFFGTGWMGQRYFGRTTTNDNTNESSFSTNIYLCWTNGPINSYCGGFIGSDSGNFKIRSCYSSGNFTMGIGSGGIYGSNTNYISVENSYSWAIKTTTTPVPGSIGGYNSGTSIITNCYGNSDRTVSSPASGATLTVSNMYNTNNNWNNSTARTTLIMGPVYSSSNLIQPVGLVWTEISNFPWRMSAFNRNPYSSTGTNPVSSALTSTLPVVYTRLGTTTGFTYNIISNRTNAIKVSDATGILENAIWSTTTNESISIDSSKMSVTSGGSSGNGTINFTENIPNYYINILYTDDTSGFYTVSLIGGSATVCYLGTTKILCIVDDKEIWIPIQDISEGMMVKTYIYGARKIIKKTVSKFMNTKEPNNKKLYKLPKEKHPDLFENLYTTGNHSILVDKLTEEQEKKSLEIWSKLETLHKKYLLMACVNENAEPCDFEEMIEVYQVVLENRSSRNRYGIYANGILSESMSLAVYHRKRDRIINYDNSNDY